MYWMLLKWVVLIVAVVALVSAFTSKVYNKIYNDGVTAEQAVWQEKEVRESAARNAKIAQLEAQREKEREDQEARMAIIAQSYAKEIEDVHSQKSRDIADAYSGALKLFWVTETTGGRRNDRGAEKGTGGATGRSDGPARCELPSAVAANLFELANDADRNTKQLSACQEIIRSDRANQTKPDEG